MGRAGLQGRTQARGLASRRFRRRVLFAGIGAVVLLVVVGTAVLIGNTGEKQLPLTNRPVIVDTPRPHAALTATDRRTIVLVSRAFIRTAVRREHTERAWPLVSDALRQGTTRAAWKAGTLPFPPYPVRNARWSLAYSDVGEVGLDVLVQSSDKRIKPLVHRMTLVRSTRASGPRWLVDGWVAMAATPGGFGDAAPDPAKILENQAAPRTTPSPGRVWVLAPFVVLLAAILIPVTIMLRHSRAERRVLRAHGGSRRGRS